MTNTPVLTPTPNSAATPDQPGFDPPTRDNLGAMRVWARRALALLLLVVAVGAWYIGQTYLLLMVAPLAVTTGTLVHRGLAAWRKGLNTSLIGHPLDPANSAATTQFLLRSGLGALVVLAADIALLDVEAGGLPTPTTQWILVIAPLPLFVLFQLIPGSVVSRSLNIVALVVAGFLAFQLVQVHYRSDTADAITIEAPFEGEWHVPSAGHSSLVTHHWTPLADQHYAVDFFIEKDGRTHTGDRSDLSAYYCWDQPLLAPATGTVVAAEDGHADQPIGQRDGDHPAGNTVVIEIDTDVYVQLSHLRSGSVQVDVGQQVAAGDIIGRCGNSGFSTEPHLHMQVQDTPGSNNHHSTGDGNSIPFRFSDITHIRDGVEHDDQTTLFRRNDRVLTNN
jgi:hypothetical protein